jgi:3-carboxy-cis,cis-muconate cycloisomerase
MKPSSSQSEQSFPAGQPFPHGLLDAIDTDARTDAAVDDRALLAAMLRVEAAMARAAARAGVVPDEAADAIADTCRPERFDIGDLGRRAVSTGAPVAALVADIGVLLPDYAKPWVHFGATTQDVVDTALMLLARDALDVVTERLVAAAGHCASLASEHRDTLQVARTLGQQALPSTFGAKAAGWLAALDDALAGLTGVRDGRLAVQFGGAAGTLAPLGEHGVEVLGLLAEQLGLAEPTLPWHTARGRVHELAGALGTALAALGKIATDVVFCAGTEVAELAEPEGSGGSSAMPHKQNPIRSALTIAAARRSPGLVGTLLSAGLAENERAAGSWHAEWQPLRELLRLAGGAAARAEEVLGGLRVYPQAMRRNLELTGGLLMAESVTTRLAGPLGRQRAHELVTEACRRAVAEGSGLRAVLLADPSVREHLSTADIDAALDPSGYLGSAGRFVDRALAAHPGKA